MNKTNLPISDKESIRIEVKKRITRMSEKEKTTAFQSICSTLVALPEIQKTKNIILYMGLGDEVMLSEFLERAKKLGMNIVTITPNGDHGSIPEDGIIIVPGRAFTLSGKRIGRGGGWYDTFLQKYPRLYAIGVCFECQIFAELPQDEWDIAMDLIITSKM